MADIKSARSLWPYAMILLSGVFYAMALKYFVLPSKVILTGTEGVAAALSYYFESDWLFIILYLVFQSGLLAFGYMKVSRTFALRSLIVVVTVAVVLAILPDLIFARPEPENERIILVLFGGLLAGSAKALAFRHRGSTGDEDILGAYFAMKYLRPVGYVAILAATVSTAFGMMLDLFKYGAFESVVNTLMYTCIYIFASAETLNNLYHKFKITMLVIISDKAEAVGQAIKTTFTHRTYTIQQGVGGYRGEKVSMVRAIVTQEELPRLTQAIITADPKCFYYHHDLEGVSRHYYISPFS